MLGHGVPAEWIEEMDDETMLGWVIACVEYDGFYEYNFTTRKFNEVKK